MSSVRLLPLTLVLAATTCVVHSQPASEPVVQLEPLTVTAQHRAQTATDVPISLSAVSGTAFESGGITRYEDLAPLVPGFFAAVQSPNAPTLNIRGISMDSTDPRAEARVSVFQDGVSLTRTAGSVVELFDLERVEVLKGPQTTLFGRGAETGALALHSRRPEPGFSARLTVGAGDYGRRAADGFVNASLAGDRLLARVAFTATHRDGTVDNLAGGPALNGRETVAVRPSLRWLPAEGTTIDLIFNLQRDTPPGTSFKSGVIPTSRGDTNPFTAAELNRAGRLGLDRTVWGGALLAERRLSPAWTLHAVTGWRQYDHYESYDGDGSRFFLLEASEANTGRQLSQELRLNYDAGGRLAGSVGATWFHERGRQDLAILTDERAAWPFLHGSFRANLLASGLPAGFVDAAVPAVFPFAPQTTLPAGFALFAGVPSLAGLANLAGAPLKPLHTDTYVNSARSEAGDVFADGTWCATDRLEFTAGLRLTSERQTAGYYAPVSATPSALGFLFNASPNFAVAPTAGELTDSDRSTGWSGRAAARWIFSPDLNAFATVARGRRPPSFVITSTDRFRVGEESVVNTELGLKGRALARRVLWTASIFQYRYRHFQTAVQDPANPARFLTVDAGRATGRGGEFTLQGALRRGVELVASYGYTDATFDATGENGSRQRYAGSSFRLTARHTASLGAVLTHDAGRAGRLSLAPVWQYKSAVFFDDDNTRLGGTLRQPGFAVVNLRLGWANRARTWEATAFATNLFDRDYLVDAGNFGAGFGLPTFVRAEPRLLGFDVSRRW